MTDKTIKGVVYDGKDVSLVPITQDTAPCGPRDALVEVTLCAVCTSDLHIRRGAVPRARAGTVLGHEFVGVIKAMGSDVPLRNKSLKVGTRVAANCITFCGDCYYCRHGYINNCECGGWELGCRVNGAQQNGLVRVPFADTGLAPIPDTVTDEQALFVGDILASGYFSVAELGNVREGDCVAVIGAGPVGLCAMQCARLRGAKTVVAIEVDQHRLDLAREHNLADLYLRCGSDVADEDIESRVKEVNEGRGADCVVEAAGMNASFQLAWRVARPNGTVAIVAMYEAPPTFPLPLMYGKNLCWRTGGVDAIHSDYLLKMIEEGKIDTSFLITHRGSLDDILSLYETLDHAHETQCLKCVVSFQQSEPKKSLPAALERLQRMEDARLAGGKRTESAQTTFDRAFDTLTKDAKGGNAEAIEKMKTLLCENKSAISANSAARAQKTIDLLVQQQQAASSGPGTGGSKFSFSCKMQLGPQQPNCKTTNITPASEENTTLLGPGEKQSLCIHGCDETCKSVTLNGLSICTVNSDWTYNSCPKVLRAMNCSDTVITTAPVSGSVYLEGCKNCTISVAAHQIRLKNCHDCLLQFVCPSVPVIEMSSGITVAPFVLAEDAESHSNGTLCAMLAAYGFAGTLEEMNHGSKLNDFHWLSTTEPSPNWTCCQEKPVHVDTW